MVVACHAIPRRMNTQSTAVACLRQQMVQYTKKTRSRWLPATREKHKFKGVTKSSGKGTRNLRRELRTRGLAGESTIQKKSVVRLLASSALRSRFLSPPIGVVGSNFYYFVPSANWTVLASPDSATFVDHKYIDNR